MTSIDTHGNAHRPAGSPLGGQFAPKHNSTPDGALTPDAATTEAARLETIRSYYSQESARLTSAAYDLEAASQEAHIKAFIAEVKSIEPRAETAVFSVDIFEDSASFKYALDADGKEIELEQDPHEVLAMSAEDFMQRWGQRSEHPEVYTVRFSDHTLVAEVTPEMTEVSEALSHAAKLDGPHGIFTAAISRTLEHNPAAAAAVKNLTREQAERLYVDYIVPALDDVLDHFDRETNRGGQA